MEKNLDFIDHLIFELQCLAKKTLQRREADHDRTINKEYGLFRHGYNLGLSEMGSFINFSSFNGKRLVMIGD
jgi:hypothetical protein